MFNMEGSAVMPQNPVRWSQIYVQDVSLAKKFYEGTR